MLKDAVQGNQLENVRKLYEASFPESEKKPFAFMLKKQKEGCFDILAIEDEQGKFCGLAIMMLSGGLALLDYLAIEPDCQSGGIGSRTLGELCGCYGKERIVVEIESTAEENPVSSRSERLRRKAFYLRNGMVPMDFLVELFGVEMEVLTFGSEITFEQYYAIYAQVLPASLTEKIRLLA
ncbi:hypothetical protein [Acetatifactor aquisgranensis]|uniref:hypothetical protein n=1 Tax=Acetatifactor aquisgranensis TaxID=2941233 RepID=UPI00203B9855|nr:hypothetical protein [Acetatifactor aquisgranensis]MCI8541994.1 hypothetical protein [Lachnospiraceae bacterium]